MSWSNEPKQCEYYGCPNKGELVKFVTPEGRIFFFCPAHFLGLRLGEIKHE